MEDVRILKECHEKENALREKVKEDPLFLKLEELISKLDHDDAEEEIDAASTLESLASLKENIGQGSFAEYFKLANGVDLLRGLQNPVRPYHVPSRSGSVLDFLASAVADSDAGLIAIVEKTRAVENLVNIAQHGCARAKTSLFGLLRTLARSTGARQVR